MAYVVVVTFEFEGAAIATEVLGEYDTLKDSIERARKAGVPEDKIIHNFEEGERFFMGD